MSSNTDKNKWFSFFIPLPYCYISVFFAPISTRLNGVEVEEVKMKIEILK